MYLFLYITTSDTVLDVILLATGSSAHNMKIATEIRAAIERHNAVASTWLRKPLPAAATNLEIICYQGSEKAYLAHVARRGTNPAGYVLSPNPKHIFKLWWPTVPAGMTTAGT